MRVVFLNEKVRVGDIRVVETHPYLVLETPKYEVVVPKKHLYKLFRHLGVRVTKYRRMTRDERMCTLTSAIQENSEKTLVFTYLCVENGTLFLVRVATPEYTPIPHRTLFTFVEEILKSMGITVYRKQTTRFLRRTTLRLQLDRTLLDRTDEPYAVYLQVSNANTVRDAIHISLLVQNETCENSIVVEDYAVAVHRGTLESILMRVEKRIREMVSRRFRIERLVSLLDEPLDAIRLRETIEKLSKGMSRRDRSLLEWRLQSDIKRYGYNQYALLQSISYVASRTRNNSVARRLYNSMRRMIHREMYNRNLEGH
ncbi:MAG: hypothetical protein DRO12_05060 [Thermoprotei archaeon]|nr:MAG: hypothetical protein DRO12_05060 [Thermoprotei archaeon]